MQAQTPQRSLIQRLFRSADEGRLRAGWRLLLHLVLFGISFLIVSAFAGVLVLVFGLPLPAPGEIDSPFFILIPAISITLATWLARRWLDRRSFASLGLQLDSHTLPDLLFGIFLPGVLLALVFLAFWRIGWLTIEGWAGDVEPTEGLLATSLGSSLLLWVIVGYQEELLSRGYQLQNLAEGLGLPWGVVVSSGIFGVLHILNPNAGLSSTLGIFAAGIFLAYAFIRTDRLWMAIGLHIGWNFFLGTVFGFPVSGVTPGFRLIRHTVVGPEWITGGAFGPEAGFVVLPTLLLGALWIRAFTRRRDGYVAPARFREGFLGERLATSAPTSQSEPEAKNSA